PLPMLPFWQIGPTTLASRLDGETRRGGRATPEDAAHRSTRAGPQEGFQRGGVGTPPCARRPPELVATLASLTYRPPPLRLVPIWPQSAVSRPTIASARTCYGHRPGCSPQSP